MVFSMVSCTVARRFRKDETPWHSVVRSSNLKSRARPLILPEFFQRACGGGGGEGLISWPQWAMRIDCLGSLVQVA